MSLLQMLLGQQAAPIAGQAPVEGNPLIVQGNRTATEEEPAYVDPYADFLLGNKNAVREVRAAEEEAREVGGRKGMFGVKGTLRDVLGVVGDAFLVQSGNKALYGPTREREKLADALAGFSVDPIAAAERATGVNPEFGQEVYNMYMGQRQKENAGMIDAQNATTRQGELDYQMLKQGRTEASQAIAGALAAGTPEALAYAERLAENAARAYNTTPEALGFKPGMTPDEARVFAGRSATTNQNLNLPLAERRTAVAEGNLAARNRAVGVMAGRLGLDQKKFQEAIEQNDWDSLMDLFDLDVDNRAAQNRDRRRGRGSGNSQPAAQPTPARRFGPPRN